MGGKGDTDLWLLDNSSRKTAWIKKKCSAHKKNIQFIFGHSVSWDLSRLYLLIVCEKIHHRYCSTYETSFRNLDFSVVFPVLYSKSCWAPVGNNTCMPNVLLCQICLYVKAIWIQFACNLQPNAEDLCYLWQPVACQFCMWFTVTTIKKDASVLPSVVDLDPKGSDLFSGSGSE